MTINKAILIGRLGAKPELEEREGFKQVKVSFATTEKYKNRAGEKVEDTEWHNLFFYNAQAEIAAKYLEKGSKLYIEGRIKNKKHIGNDGIERIYPKIIVKDMQMLDSKPKGERPRQANDAAGFDDDIPF